MRRVSTLVISGTFVLGVSVALFAVLNNYDRNVIQSVKLELLDVSPLRGHYFVNDIVGVSPAKEGMPDAYVISHSSRAAVLLGDENGYKQTAADRYGLYQDEDVDGWGAVSKIKASTHPGLHLSYYHTFIVGNYVPGDENTGRKLNIHIPWRANSSSSGAVLIESKKQKDATSIDVSFQGAGSFWVETRPPPSDGFAIKFTAQGFSEGEIYVGAESIVVDKKKFTLSTKDMHSLAMTEIDGDTGVEFSVVRGGIRGRIGDIDPDARDYLIDADSGRNIAGSFAHFKKKGCPGRQSAWADVDGDGDLDLYISCGRPNKPTADFPNQLYLQENEDLIESASRFGLDIMHFGSFRFIDWDQDLDMDLWWADSDGDLYYYENKNNEFVKKDVYPDLWESGYRSPQLLLSDFNANGKPDLAVIHPSANHMLINQRDSGNTVVAFSEYGLPSASEAAHLADVDLDGDLDYLTSTQGIYLRDNAEKYSHIAAEFSNKLVVYDSRLVSFSSEKGRYFLLGTRRCLPGILCGGRRMLLSAIREFVRPDLRWLDVLGLVEPYDWDLFLLARSGSETATHNEVAVTIEGVGMNPMSLGARLEVNSDVGRQSHWVGESESSLYSQADMNIYLSIEKGKNLSGKVHWLDGCVTSVTLESAPFQQYVKRPDSCTD